MPLRGDHRLLLLRLFATAQLDSDLASGDLQPSVSKHPFSTSVTQREQSRPKILELGVGILASADEREQLESLHGRAGVYCSVRSTPVQLSPTPRHQLSPEAPREQRRWAPRLPALETGDAWLNRSGLPRRRLSRFTASTPTNSSPEGHHAAANHSRGSSLHLHPPAFTRSCCSPSRRHPTRSAHRSPGSGNSNRAGTGHSAAHSNRVEH